MKQQSKLTQPFENLDFEAQQSMRAFCDILVAQFKRRYGLNYIDRKEEKCEKKRKRRNAVLASAGTASPHLVKRGIHPTKF